MSNEKLESLQKMVNDPATMKQADNESVEDFLAKAPVVKAEIHIPGDIRIIEGKTLFAIAMTESGETINAQAAMAGVWGPTPVIAVISETIDHLAKTIMANGVPEGVAIQIVMDGVKEGLDHAFDIDFNEIDDEEAMMEAVLDTLGLTEDQLVEASVEDEETPQTDGSNVVHVDFGNKE